MVKIRHCLICMEYKEVNSRLLLCNRCSESFVHAGEYGKLSSVFFYDSALRNLILQVKVAGSYLALSSLSSMFLQSELVRKNAVWCDAVMPAPSSLWGRLRGRIDLAWNLANDLSQRWKKQRISPPGALYWRINKRSFKDRKEDFIPILSQSPQSPHPDCKRILLVDDIVTSGETLYRLSQNTFAEVRFLTMARAR